MRKEAESRPIKAIKMPNFLLFTDFLLPAVFPFLARFKEEGISLLSCKKMA
jgi:hypothetical protein